MKGAVIANVASLSIEASFAATRIGQGFVALYQDDDESGRRAAGYFGQAFLQLIGVGFSAFQAKGLNNARKGIQAAAEAEKNAGRLVARGPQTWPARDGKVFSSQAELKAYEKASLRQPQKLIEGPQSLNESTAVAPSKIVNTKEFQFADRTGFEDIAGYRSLKANIAKYGLKDKVIEYVEINGQKYVVRGNQRLQIAEDLGKADQLSFKKVELPFLGYRNKADVIEESINIIQNRPRGTQ